MEEMIDSKTCGECRYLDKNRYCEFLDFEPKPQMKGCANFEPKPTNSYRIDRYCLSCGNVTVADAGYYAGSSFYHCETCGRRGMSDIFPKATVFHKITKSPEVLAKEIVTTSYDEFKDCTVYWAWLGNGRREAYYSQAEAIAATVAKLKEVCDE